MNYEVNDEIITDGGEYTVIAVIHYEGACDDSINLYVGRHADGHCALIATDNASSWVVGDEYDAQRNYILFDLLGDRIDIDAIRAVDTGLADWVKERQEAAEKTSARITRIEQRGDAQLIDWECGGGADRVTTDFAWPGNVLEYNDDGKINHGWVLLEGTSLAVGDTVTLA